MTTKAKELDGAGTAASRLTMLLDALTELVGDDHPFAADPPEARLLAKVKAKVDRLAAIESATPGEVREIDCGDNSCYFAKTKGGMRTNGGCQCFSQAGFSKGMHAAAREMLPELLRLRAEVQQMRADLAAEKQRADRLAEGIRWYRRGVPKPGVLDPYFEWEREHGHLVTGDGK